MASPLWSQANTSRFDDTFQKYSKRYFGVGYDWRTFKAQAITESNLDPNARSWVGARGIMQLMPSTFAEIQTKNSAFQSVDDQEWNIAAGIYYDRRLWRLWRDSVDQTDHDRFMFASYNAGRVPLLRAQTLARLRALDPRLWGSVAAVASEVPRWRHAETLTYVQRIGANLQRMDPRGRVLPSPPADSATIIR
ncbi:MAG: transglycosylase SLT domain-containing protein [Gemmatimonadales bacterium]